MSEENDDIGHVGDPLWRPRTAQAGNDQDQSAVEVFGVSDAEYRQLWTTIFLAEVCRSSKKSIEERVRRARNLANAAADAYAEEWDGEAEYQLTEEGRELLTAMN